MDFTALPYGSELNKRETAKQKLKRQSILYPDSFPLFLLLMMDHTLSHRSSKVTFELL